MVLHTWTYINISNCSSILCYYQISRGIVQTNFVPTETYVPLTHIKCRVWRVLSCFNFFFINYAYFNLKFSIIVQKKNGKIIPETFPRCHPISIRTFLNRQKQYFDSFREEVSTGIMNYLREVRKCITFVELNSVYILK